MEKRGQVTIFIIIGLALLFVVGTTLFFKEIIIERGLFRDIKEPEIIPEQIIAVDYYVDSCIEQVTEEALSLIGTQGGYISLEGIPTLEVLPGFNTAYWYYSNGAIFSDYPSKEDIEKELEDYVENNLERCISNFDLLEGEFSIEAKGVVSKANIEDESVIIKVRYPLNIAKDGIEYYLADHVLDFDIKLGKIYDLAKTIMDKENQELWLENRTLDIIYLYEEEVPHDGVEFSCAPKIWKKNDIEERFKDILNVNAPFYTIKGTDYDVYYLEEENIFWDIGKNYEDLFVNFQFNEEWPFELDVNPSEGSYVIARPFEGDLKIIDFCTNYYTFSYDVKHPILVTVSDGIYDFNFAIDTVIRNDKPRNREQSPYKEDKYADYCELRDNELEVYSNYVGSDGKFNNLANASVFFNCVNHNCYIGDTNDFGFLREKFPICANGVLEIRKDGYQSEKTVVTTFDDGDKYINLELEPFIEKRYNVMVYDKINNRLEGPRNLRSDEEVILEILNLDGDEILSGDVIFYPDEENSVKLIPAAYHIKGSLIKTSSTLIEGKTFEVCKGAEILGVCIGGTETVVVEDQNIEELVTGGVELDWLVDRSRLYDSNEIIFYVINQGTPKNYDDLLVTYDVNAVTSNFINEVMPAYA